MGTLVSVQQVTDGQLFMQKRVVACAFLDILIGNEPRKTVWLRAEVTGDPGPWRQQALVDCGIGCRCFSLCRQCSRN